jgi:very-short-patch-repair endonuclease
MIAVPGDVRTHVSRQLPFRDHGASFPNRPHNEPAPWTLSFVDLDDLLLRQAGVLSLPQAVAAGMSARTVQRRVATGAWRALHPRVYLAGGHRLTDEARIRAAALWCGDDATVSGVAAAFWHGMMPRAAGAVDVTVPRTVRLAPDRGVLPHRRDLDPADRVKVVGDGPAADRAAVRRRPRRRLDVPRPGAATPRPHRRAARRALPQLGRRGSTRASRLLAAAGDGAGSTAERLLVKHLRRAGITGWVLGHPLGPYAIDLAFPAARVAVEVDGWAWHADPARFTADRHKGNAITRAGWDLLRYTWHDLDGRPGACLQEIDDLLARAAA